MTFLTLRMTLDMFAIGEADYGIRFDYYSKNSTAKAALCNRWKPPTALGELSKVGEMMHNGSSRRMRG